MAPKRQQQPDEQPDIYEGGVLVTPERRAFLESLSTPTEEETAE